MLIEQIKFIEAQVFDVEHEMQLILDKLDSPIPSIPGIACVTATTILGEIGDISRFSNASKLAAYAGIDASVSQSGEYSSTNNKMSKRSSAYLRKAYLRKAYLRKAYLRKALFQVALMASFHDPVFSAFYNKKRSEGKHHLTSVGAVARKLCNTIFAVLKYNVAYEVRLK